MKDKMQQIGIRSDRPMTMKEIYTAAGNYNAVKRAAESSYNPDSKVDRFSMRIQLTLVGFGILYMIVAVILTFVG